MAKIDRRLRRAKIRPQVAAARKSARKSAKAETIRKWVEAAEKGKAKEVAP